MAPSEMGTDPSTKAVAVSIAAICVRRWSQNSGALSLPDSELFQKTLLDGVIQTCGLYKSKISYMTEDWACNQRSTQAPNQAPKQTKPLSFLYSIHVFLALYIPSIQVGYMGNVLWRTGEVFRVKCVLSP
jgi:hypothetical protein